MGCSNPQIGNSNDILARLNASGSQEWLEDPANDLTGINPQAVYLTISGESCAVWVFGDVNLAKGALESGLDFPGQINYGSDLKTNLGVILVSPYAGAACEVTAAAVFEWE